MTSKQAQKVPRPPGRPPRPICNPATLQALVRAETAYRTASQKATSAAERRNSLVLRALVEGATHAQIAEATGLSRGRISQIKPPA